jgi:hypothetical protein
MASLAFVENIIRVKGIARDASSAEFCNGIIGHA